jgi:hypothetical protein
MNSSDILAYPAFAAPFSRSGKVFVRGHEGLGHLRVLFGGVEHADWSRIARDADDERGKYHKREGACRQQVDAEDNGLVERLKMVIHEDIK